MSKLIIVGNGFDLYHGLPTSYSGFGQYLLEQPHTQCSDIQSLISYPHCEKDIWSNFEANLASIDMEYLDQKICEYIPELGSDAYCREMDACLIQAKVEVDALTIGLRNEFASYIRRADATCVENNKLLNIDKNAQFMSFNYTRTLERIYCVPADNVFYIHGTADSEGSIVLGHAMDPKSFAVESLEPVVPPTLADDERQLWEEYMANQHVPFLAEARELLASYYSNSFKNTAQIIEDDFEFFKSLSCVDTVQILGHSMSEVDSKYFEAIRQFVPPHCRWVASYHTLSDKANISGTFERLGVSENSYQLFKLCELG